MAEINLTATLQGFRRVPGTDDAEERDEYVVMIEHDRGEHPGYYPRTVTVASGEDPTPAIRGLVAEIRALIEAEVEPAVPLGVVDLG